ncbi:1-aminocyclopropane-1-carboxylate deaminase/D-cysteine desulfhydrase [Imtechella halotolerans]|uniref:1-aminocyclopropane-1-carboxylate deaminase n=1 Tax=Imtechella halotolerans K1 TaxID=946077 RepID=I0WIG0_9FLAO|nr:pyridoxal-phosphate dependent enzyme [Imtechella halotolerans]EID76176.1 1-aminocyclopropane-1-carboxylate deaminase [Imtechella halotolerans K1]WMQ63362.1 pyridoxal-phosphate dependent enzyme [Imtechella halotolerans]
MIWDTPKEISNQEVQYQFPRGIRLTIKREDKIHPFVSGNKFRKLKYNVAQAIHLGKHTLLTFGGAYSNHIAAVAAVGRLEGMKTIGIIRGEELQGQALNSQTLLRAQKDGMKFRFVSRELYRLKATSGFLNELNTEFESAYIIPEGGTNEFAVQGCEEILDTEDSVFTHIACSAGTGGTASGIIRVSNDNQRVLVFPAVKGDFLLSDIATYTHKTNWDLITAYHFGGYAKVTDELITFLNEFYVKTGIPLDPVYTGKMVFGIFDMISTLQIPDNAHILAIHTGGLQGIQGMNTYLQQKNRPLINYE